MAEHGLSIDAIDDYDQALLVRAYSRRKQFEARLIASEVGYVVAAIMGADVEPPATIGNTSGSTGTKPHRHKEVSPEHMLRAMGAKVD